MNLKYTPSGFIYIFPNDDCKATVDAMLDTNYQGDFCIADSFDHEFVARLMEAGFLVMSANLRVFDEDGENDHYYILLPKLHTVRSALFFENLHIKKSIRRFFTPFMGYELKADADFELIVDRCVEKHGDDWLTPPLVACIKKIRENAKKSGVINGKLEIRNEEFGTEEAGFKSYPSSFALYRYGKLVAGEFGVICGRVYTSYSGFYDEDNAGTVQIILTTRYLQEKGFMFFDLGMPLDYKTELGAVDISAQEFVDLFRGACQEAKTGLRH